MYHSTCETVEERDKYPELLFMTCLHLFSLVFVRHVILCLIVVLLSGLLSHSIRYTPSILYYRHGLPSCPVVVALCTVHLHHLCKTDVPAHHAQGIQRPSKR